MAGPKLPSPTKEISIVDARRFMLSHHGLYPPRQRSGKDSILDFIQKLGSIQFDPINIVGRNPDLVLQARIEDYKPAYLDELLYEDRLLVDGWDKMASIYSTEDWPNFFRRREMMNQPNADSRRPPQKILDEILQEVSERGPLSSLEFKESEIVNWHWGPTKIVRAVLESLFSMSKVGVHHRVNNRRAFDLIERLLPAETLSKPDPFASVEEYHDWHVLRRLGGLGLADSKSGEYWMGILGMKSPQRRATLSRLSEQGKVIALTIAEIENQVFFMRAEDWPTLEVIQGNHQPALGAALIAALDNLIWNRGLIQHIFDFEYVWEVYKPKAKRRWGYYVLPVIFGDQFIGRIEPKFDKKKKILRIENWWWEEEVHRSDEMETALISCLTDFSIYLDAREIVLGDDVKNQKSLRWIQKIATN